MAAHCHTVGIVSYHYAVFQIPFGDQVL